MARQLRVAEVLSESRILINAGQDESINHGDAFTVYEIGPDIQDPETKESLGKLEIKKGQFVAIDVQPKVTIARVAKRTVIQTRRIPTVYDIFRKAQYEEHEVDVPDSVKMDVSAESYSDALVIRKNDLVRRL